MDIEEYLKQKRELEGKKELLEAKEKLRQEKEKRERVREEKGEVVVKGESFLKPWMIWDIIVLVVVIGLFSTAYFFPKENYDEDRIQELIDERVKEAEKNLLTGSAAAGGNSGSEDDEDDEGVVETDGGDENVSESASQETRAKQPGPKFSIYLKDLDLGAFDEDGKINGEVLLISGASLYEYALVVENKENKDMLCKVDEELDFDTDLDGEIDDQRVKLDLHLLKFDPLETEDLPDSVVGSGEIIGTYEARCYFCLDIFCDSYAQYTEEAATGKFKVRILEAGDGDGGNSS